MLRLGLLMGRSLAFWLDVFVGVLRFFWRSLEVGVVRFRQ